MKYEIGQKVETPLGVGEVIDIFTREDKTISECKVCIKTHSVWFGVDDLKPYRTPHEKLLDMGLHLKITKNWAGGVFSHEWWNDNNDRVVVFFVDEKVTTVYEGNNDIMRIIPEYLEWLEEGK